MKLATPDITRIQSAALVGVLAALLRAFGVYDLDEDQQAALTAALALLGALGLFDTLLRSSRAKHLGARVPADVPLGDPDDDGLTDDLLEDTAGENDSYDPAAAKPAAFS